MAAIIKVTSSELKQRLDKAFDQVAARATMATVMRAKAHILNELIPSDDPQPVDRGIYRAGFQTAKIAGGAALYNVAPHAAFIEHGVKAGNVKIGKALIDALAAWATRKGLVKRSGRGVAAKAAQAQAARAAAWAIATALKRGIFNQGRGLRHIERVKPLLSKWLAHDLKKEIERLAL
jgi:hypothetical protein